MNISGKKKEDSINELLELNDIELFLDPMSGSKGLAEKTIDELIGRDKQREEDGFPRKLKVGRVIRNKKGDQVKVIPVIIEDKFYHDNSFDEVVPSMADTEEDKPFDIVTGGHKEKVNVGDVIGKNPLSGRGGEGGEGIEGGGSNVDHLIDSKVYELGQKISEKWRLPNIEDKKRKKSLTKMVYDLTDKNRGEGQVLAKGDTLKQILKTNIGLGRIDLDKVLEEGINPLDLLISPKDKIYHIMSTERDYESQAVVFFMRDYSISMEGEPAKNVVTQHLLMYAWLVYQYKNNVIAKFIVHDSESKEVADFNEYYNLKVGGGTRIFTAFELMNKIVNEENLVRDYNIYAFYGSDGEDFSSEGSNSELIEEIEKMLGYVNRAGISVVKHSGGESALEKSLKSSGLLEKYPNNIKMDVMQQNAGESRIFQGISNLLS